MLNVVSVNDVYKLFEDAGKCEYETILLHDALGRILGEDVISHQDLPGFKRSSMDGYAVKASDTYLCSESSPAVLKKAGEVSIGFKPDFIIENNLCGYIPTGGMLPDGADAVVMIEDCETIGDEIVVGRSVSKWENVVNEDDDVKNGQIVLNKCIIIKPEHIAVLSGLGITKLKVKRKLNVGIISTGNEIISLEDEYSIPKVRDINGNFLKSQLSEDGCNATYFGIVKDDEEVLYNAVKMALIGNDIVLLSGGSSAGTHDFTIKIMERLGEVLFHGISVKPGKPTLAARTGNKYIIGLPGHPLSCAVIYKFIIRKLLHNMMDIKSDNGYIEAVMIENYHKAKGRTEYLPVEYKDGKAYPIYAKSSAISILSKCSGFVIIERDSEGINNGEKVKVWR